MKYSSLDTSANIDVNENFYRGTTLFADVLAEKHRKLTKFVWIFFMASDCKKLSLNWLSAFFINDF